MMRFHTQTAGVSLTAQQPLVNIVRTTIEALAGVLGGTQSLHTNSFDEALALPTDEAVRVALRTQQVIAHESGVTNTADPLGGSYFVEKLTDEMEAAAYEYFAAHRRARRHGRGGRRPAFPQREIADAAFRYQREVDARRADRRRRQRLPRSRTSELPELHRPDPAAERRQADAPGRDPRGPRRRRGRGGARRRCDAPRPTRART